MKSGLFKIRYCLYIGILFVGCDSNEKMEEKKNRYHNSVKVWSRKNGKEKNFMKTMPDSLMNELKSTKSIRPSDRDVKDILIDELKKSGK